MSGFFVDVSDRSLVILRGNDALDLLQRLSTNDVAKLDVGDVVRTILTNEKGRIIDTLSVLKLEASELLLSGQTKSGKELQQWLQKYIIMEEAEVENVTDNFGHFLLCEGFPKGEQFNFPEAYQTHFSKSVLKNINDTTLGFIEWWGKKAFIHVVYPKAIDIALREEFMTAGFEQCSVSEFENYRVLNGIPAYPNEISTEYNPLEVGLLEHISFTKGCYIGQEVIARLDTYKKVQKSVVQLELGALPETLPAAIHSENSDEIGKITSAVSSSNTEKIMAIGFLKPLHSMTETLMFFIKNDNKVLVKSIN